MSSNTHVLQMPKGFLGIRIAQLVIGVVEVGLIAYLMSNTHGFVFSAQAWTILCGIATLIIVIYNIVATRSHSLYNMWAVLSLDCAMAVFWMSAMGALAHTRSAFATNDLLAKRYYYIWATGTYLAVLSVTAAIAALEMILFISSLIMVSIRVHRHRVNNTTVPTINMEKLENGQVQPQQQAAPQHQQFQPQPDIQQQQFQQQAPQQQMYNQDPPQAGFTPMSPMQQYPTPTQSPAPQYIAPHPQYSVQPPPHGVVEAPAAEYRGTA
ncbi:hypothetical protein E2P81_ATG08679 [Venturia nashicola]|uniref:MARVEL domain-containing protein n=1 Tax=Venturia nashicola TaxID=86259 RepID=A0A4Z1NJS9_9PEZI|nr:hypothetical protein E6O75_ATG08871 [Venturia nashicola]TLD21015.1 hypothetical protein E2P81_ATG08679 [Venturia nashicola]